MSVSGAGFRRKNILQDVWDLWSNQPEHRIHTQFQNQHGILYLLIIITRMEDKRCVHILRLWIHAHSCIIASTTTLHIDSTKSRSASGDVQTHTRLLMSCNKSFHLSTPQECHMCVYEQVVSGEYHWVPWDRRASSLIYGVFGADTPAQYLCETKALRTY